MNIIRIHTELKPNSLFKSNTISIHLETKQVKQQQNNEQTRMLIIFTASEIGTAP